MTQADSSSSVALERSNAINVVLWEALRETGADLSGYDGPEHWVAVLSELARAQHLCRAVRVCTRLRCSRATPGPTTTRIARRAPCMARLDGSAISRLIGGAMPSRNSTATERIEYRVTYEEHGRLQREACGLSARTAHDAARNAERRGATDVRVWRRPAPAKWEELER